MLISDTEMPSKSSRNKGPGQESGDAAPRSEIWVSKAKSPVCVRQFVSPSFPPLEISLPASGLWFSAWVVNKGVRCPHLTLFWKIQLLLEWSGFVTNEWVVLMRVKDREKGGWLGHVTKQTPPQHPSSLSLASVLKVALVLYRLF